MEYTIQEVAKAVGTSSRTLRHYDSVGLLQPSRTGANGYRFYDDRALVRLQRILLLRELGLGLDAIATLLAAQDDEGAAESEILGTHLELLRAERGRVERQIRAVERTIAALESTHTEGSSLMSADMFDGFDHTEFREEVEARWGADAYAVSDRWWRGLSEKNKAEWMDAVNQLNTDWVAAVDRGVDPASPTAQALAERHVAWLHSVPGTPAGDDFEAYVLGLGDMYVADERFAANYGGVEGAAFVRDALRVLLESDA